MDLAIRFAPQKNIVHFDSDVLNTLAELLNLLVIQVVGAMVLANGSYSRKEPMKSKNDTYPIGR